MSESTCRDISHEVWETYLHVAFMALYPPHLLSWTVFNVPPSTLSTTIRLIIFASTRKHHFRKDSLIYSHLFLPTPTFFFSFLNSSPSSATISFHLENFLQPFFKSRPDGNKFFENSLVWESLYFAPFISKKDILAIIDSLILLIHRKYYTTSSGLSGFRWETYSNSNR